MPSMQCEHVFLALTKLGAAKYHQRSGAPTRQPAPVLPALSDALDSSVIHAPLRESSLVGANAADKVPYRPAWDEGAR